MLLRYSYRLYPDLAQRAALARAFGCARVVFNDALAARQAAYSRQAIRFTANARFRVLDKEKLRLPKVGDVPVHWSRALPAAPSSVTVMRDAAGRFFASFVVQASREPLPATGRECGIDLGLGHFAVLDDGTKITAPRFLRRAEKKLKKAQRDLSRKQKGSRNREKARVKVARGHARVKDARRDFSTSSPRPSSAKTKR